MASRLIEFVTHPVNHHRRHFVSEDDVRIMLLRLPEDLWRRLRAVHFTDKARGNKVFGYTWKGRRDIALCALPRRVSLNRIARDSGGPEVFGALSGSQWPVLAVRRFMLYDVFLHELGHLQESRLQHGSRRLRFYRETKAKEFANHWRAELWSKPCDSKDPAHSPASVPELRAVRSGWIESNLVFKTGWDLEKRGEPEKAAPFYARALEAYPSHSYALERLGILHYDGSGGDQGKLEAAVSLLQQAVGLDQTLPDAWLWLALAFSDLHRKEEAETAFRRAVELDPYPTIARTMYAEKLSRWGRMDEAGKLFEKLLKQSLEKDSFVLAKYGAFLLWLAKRGQPRHLPAAIDVLERAIRADPDHVWNYIHLGLAYSVARRAQEARARFGEALRLDPDLKPTLERLTTLFEAPPP